MRTSILVGITAMLLLAPPTAASDYTLEIFGNANEDDTINMQDVTYTELIILEYRDRTELADGKYDGKINMQDVTQIELVILGKEMELTLIDTTDRIVTVKEPVERVVAFHSGHAETMRSITAKDKIVGVSKYVIEDEFLSEFVDYPNVGSTGSPNYEEILNLHPDIVFLYATFSMSSCEAIQNKLKELDPEIAVIRMDTFKPESYVEETRKLGYILEKKEEANELIDFYEGWMNGMDDRLEEISEDNRPKIYYENRKPYYTVGAGTGHQQKLEIAGGNNLFSDRNGYFDVDPEAVVERNPEIIVRTDAHVRGYGTDDITELSDIRNEIMNRPEFSKVAAVNNESVWVINNQIIGGVRHFVGIGYMAKWFHPELFEDLDPQAIHQEYVTEFQGLDYDLSEHGVFVYPPPEES
ncbi:MAG: ABC transporter substrate-binding protein [Euryarchaeota archaeon]|nr:ABC transporter substrate-binding protein [Euryarchaeota archaeon]